MAKDKDDKKELEGREKFKKVMDDFRKAYEYKKPFLKDAQEDVEFFLGKQWEDKDVATLDSQGVRALTINKIQPNIFLLTGIESQQRTDVKAYPEGEEDSLEAEISTSLMKNVVKMSDAEYKFSEQFEDGITTGESFIEPYIDYTHDLLHGEMKFKKVDFNCVFPAPGFKEYDMSDAPYLCKVTYGLTKDELKVLFKDAEDEIDELGSSGTFSFDSEQANQLTGMSAQNKDNYHNSSGSSSMMFGNESDAGKYDLLEYYYKKPVKKFFVADMKLGTFKEVYSKLEADRYVNAATDNEPKDQKTAQVVTHVVPEIWKCAFVYGNEEPLVEERCEFYPRWKGYPLIPFWGRRTTMPLNDKVRAYAVQGIVRQLKDLNRELNKRRTQELRILNTSANSGWIYEDKSLVDPNVLKKFGSSPGVAIAVKEGKPHPQKIMPTPLSQGHAQLAQENAADMKEITGINPDLLAMQDGGTDSGRAIHLRQKQGRVMVAKYFDNLSRTKKLTWKFILSQLSKIYSIESAIKTLGKAFIVENFSVMVPGQPDQMGNPGQPIQQIDQQTLMTTIDKVLNDASLGKYDVAIGEDAQNESLLYAKYALIADMRTQGIPIPPDILVEESPLSESTKEKIKNAIEKANAVPPQGPPRGA